MVVDCGLDLFEPGWALNSEKQVLENKNVDEDRKIRKKLEN
jgi:hypothetical protein